jgi:hypothetical protein
MHVDALVAEEAVQLAPDREILVEANKILPVEIRREQTAKRAARVEALLRRGRAGDTVLNICRISADTIRCPG